MRLTIPISALGTLGLPASDPTASDLVLAGDPEPELDVECSYRPGAPAVHTLRNGDPGYPADPDEVEIYRITSPVALLWEGEGIALAVTAGADLRPLLSSADYMQLEGQVAQLAEQADRDAADEARIEQAIERAERRRDGYT